MINVERKTRLTSFSYAQGYDKPWPHTPTMSNSLFFNRKLIKNRQNYWDDLSENIMIIKFSYCVSHTLQKNWPFIYFSIHGARLVCCKIFLSLPVLNPRAGRVSARVFWMSVRSGCDNEVWSLVRFPDVRVFPEVLRDSSEPEPPAWRELERDLGSSGISA